jgi:hypothetical protein
MTVRRPQPVEIAQLKTEFRAATAKPRPFVSSAHEWREYDARFYQQYGFGLTYREKEQYRKRNAARQARKLRNKRK